MYGVVRMSPSCLLRDAWPAAEFVPPRLAGLPSKRDSFGVVSGSLATNTDSFMKSGDNLPCVTLEDVSRKLPQCRPKANDPVILEENAQCDDLYDQVMQDIEMYDQRIDSIPIKDKSRSWPKPPMYCVWDCGQVRPSVCPACPAPPLSTYFFISYFFFFFSAPEKKKNKYEIKKYVLREGASDPRRTDGQATVSIFLTLADSRVLFMLSWV